MNERAIRHGVFAGLAGGMVFGMMMAMMGMLPMVAGLVGSNSAVVGFIVHMLISAVIGGGFGLILGATGMHGGAGTGLAYGFLWWILGPLTLMPLFMGRGFGAAWNLHALEQAVPSLIGHLVFGLVLGLTYRWLESRVVAAVRSTA
jgi:uncharacterized membrane protein YagU involved in acid resistance